MLLTVNNFSVSDPTAVVNLRCPSCRHQGTFGAFVNVRDLVLNNNTYRLGQRQCPNDGCKAHIFFVWQSQKVIASYPAERIDFDATNVPPAVVQALEEAITCHANQCFTASVIMVRKTLEELCKDRGASGKTLKERLSSLSSKVVMPPELLSGLDELRLLGNDAAHIESQSYSQVGQEEVEVGIMFTKEVLKAGYQYVALLDRLRNLKRAQ